MGKTRFRGLFIDGGSSAATPNPDVDTAVIGAGGAEIKAIKSGTIDIDPPSIPASTTSAVTATITGLASGDVIIMQPPDLEAGLIFVGEAVTAADTVTVYLRNDTVAPIDGALKTWRYLWFDLT